MVNVDDLFYLCTKRISSAFEILAVSFQNSVVASKLPTIIGFFLMKNITLQQLSLRNGQDKEDIWVAYKGLVYQLNSSRLWRAGKHYEHWAGQDLTEELKDAPHTERVFEKFVPIGRLVS